MNELNIALRAVRKERGELEWEDHAIKTAHGTFDFSAGDRIRFTGTDKQAGIANSATGTIEAIDGTHLAVRLDGPRARRSISTPRVLITSATPMPARFTPGRDRRSIRFTSTTPSTGAARRPMSR